MYFLKSNPVLSSPMRSTSPFFGKQKSKPTLKSKPTDATQQLSPYQRENVIYGGTFDPPHLGHKALLQQAINQFGLSRVLVLVSGRPGYKNTSTSFDDRFTMSKLAFADLGVCDMSDIENHLEKPTSTIRTLRALFDKLLHPRSKDKKIPFVLGVDTLKDIPNWEEPTTLLKNIHFLVTGRNGVDIPKSISLNDVAHPFDHTELDMPSQPLSSTEIRERVANGATVEELCQWVPESVARFIVDNGLYVD